MCIKKNRRKSTEMLAVVVWVVGFHQADGQPLYLGATWSGPCHKGYSFKLSLYSSQVLRI